MAAEGISIATRSGPKIPAAGYLEGEGFFGFKDIDSDFGCCCEQFWNFVRTTQFGTLLEQPNFGTSLKQLKFGCSNEVGFLAFWPCKWP